MQLNIADYPVQKLVHIVSDLLESIITTNDELMMDTPLTHFHSRAKPGISIHAYLTRILKFAPFSNEALLSLLVYFDRIALKQRYAVNSFNVHRLLITSIVVASKFTSDVYYPNSRYAKVGGLPLLELNQLELEFLFLCEFQLHVPLEDLQEYGNQLLNHAMNHPLDLVISPPPPSPKPTTTSRFIVHPVKSNKRQQYFDTSCNESKRKKTHAYTTQPTLIPKRFCPSPPYPSQTKTLLHQPSSTL
ncbi:hypothetical protein [Absidia glauca]|uniref:Cyclin n=1 Tax=Absidia glauca TaxID=4829 RepID=A0A168PL27_ABSGL|nr:hypothetical protein [Absidia glauca]